MSVTGTLLGLFIPQIIGQFLDEKYLHQLVTKPITIGIIFLFFLLVYFLQTSSTYILAKVGGNALKMLQEKCYQHLLNLPIEKVEHFQAGDLSSRLTNDMTIILKLVTRSLPQLLINGLTMVGAVYFLVKIHPLMTGLSCVFLLLIAGVVFPINKKLEDRYLSYQEVLGKLSGYITHKSQHLRLIKSFLGEEEENRQSSNFFKEWVVTYNRIVTLTTIQSVLVNAIFMGSNMFLLFIAGREVIDEKMTVASLTTFILYLIQLITPISEIAETISDLSEFNGISIRLEELFKIDTEEDTVFIDDLRNNIQFKNVTFTYPNQSTPVVENMNFILKEGQHLAIVGESGSGKSTIFSLLMRFYNNYQGNILLGGKDLRQLSPVQVRQKIAYVSQDNHLFYGSIRENLFYGKNASVSKERLFEVLQAFDLERVIRQLDRGLDSQITDTGMGLSEGQKQRLCIARAFLTEADIYLFDEVTASLDNENELKISKAIEQLTKNKTCITIAHRLNTVTDADAYLNLS